MAYANSPFWDAITLLEETLEDLEKLHTGRSSPSITHAFLNGRLDKERLVKIDAMITGIRTGLEKLRPSCTTSSDKNIQ